MPHNLNTRDWQEAMFFVGEPPWHRLGTQLSSPPTAQEAIKAAKLDWTVSEQPMLISGNGYTHVIPDRHAIVRDDLLQTKECPVLGVVGKVYAPLQNYEAFSFFDPIIESKNATYETAGALGNGERVWILAKLRDSIVVGKHDQTDKYLLLSNSHDGTSSVQIKFTPIRVVCQNTLTMALQDGKSIRVSHTRDLHERLENARDTLHRVNRRYAEIESAFQQFALISLARSRLDDYLHLVFPDPELPDEPTREYESKLKVARNDRQQSEILFAEGRGNKEDGVAGTLWAAYNGVTEYVDYYRGAHFDRHLYSIWFGEGYLIKARAFKLAYRYAKEWAN